MWMFNNNDDHHYSVTKPGEMIARQLVCMEERVELPSGGSPSKQIHLTFKTNTIHKRDKYISPSKQILFTKETNTFNN